MTHVEQYCVCLFFAEIATVVKISHNSFSRIIYFSLVHGPCGQSKKLIRSLFKSICSSSYRFDLSWRRRLRCHHSCPAILSCSISSSFAAHSSPCCPASCSLCCCPANFRFRRNRYFREKHRLHRHLHLIASSKKSVKTSRNKSSKFVRKSKSSTLTCDRISSPYKFLFLRFPVQNTSEQLLAASAALILYTSWELVSLRAGICALIEAILISFEWQQSVCKNLVELWRFLIKLNTLSQLRRMKVSTSAMPCCRNSLMNMCVF